LSVADAKALNGSEGKINVYDAKPFDYAPFVKIGKKIETKFPQVLAQVILEKCLN
jgi:hypothetical protein